MKIFLMLALILLFVSSCEEEDLQPITDQVAQIDVADVTDLTVLEIEGLRSLGFSIVSSMSVTFDQVLIDDDILISRKRLTDRAENLATFDKQAINLQDNHRQVDINRFPIRYFIEAGFTTQQRTNIVNAFQGWDNIANCAAFRNETVAANANMRVRPVVPLIASDGVTRVAGQVSDFPVNGNLANEVRLDFPLMGTRGYSNLDQVSVIQHEIGHAIGFIHPSSNETATGLAFLHGTVQNDPTSIMGVDLVQPSTNFINGNDVRAVRMLYPDLNTPVRNLTARATNQNGSFGVKSFRVTYSLDALTPYYDATINVTRLNSYTLVNNYTLLTSSTSIDLNAPAGQYRITVTPRNFGRDFLGQSASITLTL